MVLIQKTSKGQQILKESFYEVNKTGLLGTNKTLWPPLNVTHVTMTFLFIRCTYKVSYGCLKIASHKNSIYIELHDHILSGSI